MKIIRRLRPTPAMAVACLALGLSLGGTGYAVTKLPRNSVSSINVKDRSLLAKDFKTGQLPRGPAGPQGPAGPAGPAGPGSTMRWAVVRGGVVASSGGVTLAAKPGSGQYLVNFGNSVQGKLILTSTGFAGGSSGSRGEASAGPCGNSNDGLTCSASDNANTVLVQTRSDLGTLEDQAFYVAVFG